MARSLAAAFALLMVLGWGRAYALGLGEITLNSALNQKLDAEIELLDTRGLSAAEIIAQLGTADDFARVGVERFFFLTELRFKVESRGGRHVLHVTSAQPVTEPFVNFLVQVMWPNGRLLKEYTLLLDPPAFTNQAAAGVAAPGRTDPGGGGAGRVAREPSRPDSQVSLATPPTAANTPSPIRESADRLTGDTYGVTDRDDTLWRIASRARRGDATVHQTMLAIARLNPEAFIGGNVNLVKAGYVLRLPDENEAKALDRAEAIAAVAEHNRAWRAYREGGSLSMVADASGAAPGGSATPAAQMDATGRAVTTPASATRAEGELRILAGDAGEGDSAQGGSGAAEALEAKLAATEEEIDRLSRERDEAASQRDQVAAEVEQAKRQIEVRDQQIAQLQEQLKAAAAAEQPAGAAEAPEAPKQARADEGLPSLLQSPVVLIGAGVVVVLLLVVALTAMRRRRAVTEEEFPVVMPPSRRPMKAVSAAATAAVADVGADAVEDDDTSAGVEAPRVSERTATAAPARESDESVGAQTSDVIGEADIYIAYGRFPQAVNLLSSALADDPDRSDVRLKLLEVYAETRDAENFSTHMNELVARCDDNDMLLEARELEAKFREGEVSDAPSAISTAGKLGVAQAPATETIEDFDLDFDADDAALKLDLDQEPTPPARQGSDDLGGDLGIDFDPDREVPRERGATARAGGSAASADLDEADVAVDEANGEFDLQDLQFEADRTASPSAKPAADAADDAFDFLDEEDTASTKLDLARAYIDMGDDDGAREILAEVVQEGSAEQRKMADELLARLS